MRATRARVVRSGPLFHYLRPTIGPEMPHPILQLVLAEGAGSALGGVMPIVLMFAVVYFIVLRPMSRQEKDRKKRVELLKKGDQVVIGGGILGRISNLDDPKVAVVE